MRKAWRAVAGACVGLAVAGCLAPATAPQSRWLDTFRSAGPQGADVVALHVALLEGPAADKFLDRELWAALDEQAVDVERRAALDGNGFRVGLVSGIPPAGLQTLLTSERACVNPHQVRMKAGQNKAVHLGPARPKLAFDLQLDAKPQPMALELAQCLIDVVPALDADGRVKLTLTPGVQHGGRALLPAVTETGPWPLTGGKTTERFAPLACDVTLAVQEYVVVGTRSERAGTLGYACFVRNDGDRPPTQRVLVIRAGRGSEAPSGLPPLDAPGEPTAALKVTPLAAQAARTVRGTGE